VDVEKPPAQMRPAKGQYDLAIITVAPQRLEPNIAIHLQHTAKTRQMRARMFRPAIAGIDIGHRRQSAALPGAIINRICPYSRCNSSIRRINARSAAGTGREA
jgi:hypothetical protein